MKAYALFNYVQKGPAFHTVRVKMVNSAFTRRAPRLSPGLAYSTVIAYIR